jgi:UDPglucose--hexose-1-phosphate uridylyltransferase
MPTEVPHRRLNPLTGDWVLVSPERTSRPWQGRIETLPPVHPAPYDPECYLCPGNARAGGRRNPQYTSTFIFDNDFPALVPIESRPAPAASSLFQREDESGYCRVVCFSPRHDLTLPELPLAQVEAIVAAWSDQTRDLASRSDVGYVQVFENKGEMMGCSNPHPHSQVWATRHVPNEPAKEAAAQASHLHQTGECLLCAVVREEVRRGERVVAHNESFIALVPFWAVWPFELLLIARTHAASLPDLNPRQVRDLAGILRTVTTLYDNLFEVSFPYSMGFHQAPGGEARPGTHHLHAHFYPPLLRSATVRKFMVGYEMLALPQRDLAPETAAERLRRLPTTHYLNRRTAQVSPAG